MAVTRYKLALNNARFPLVSSWGQRAVVVPGSDLTTRTFRGYQGAEENLDYNIPQILGGENFVPVTNGVKSVGYVKIGDQFDGVFKGFDQVFPLRDDEENAVLFSPAGGRNFRKTLSGAWSEFLLENLWAAQSPALYLSTTSTNTPATAKVSRAYVDGRTIVAYSNIALTDTDGSPDRDEDGSLYVWNPSTQALELIYPFDDSGEFRNLPTEVAIGTIGGVASSNGYLLVWSGLSIYWAFWDGTSFDFAPFKNGAATGSGGQIPEDVQGPITAVIPVSGGFIIFTTKNAVAAFYTANNFEQPWVFRAISNAGGIESYEQATVDGNLSSIYAYTTGGLQRISLNSAESDFPDVTDFLGGRWIEHFNTDSLTFHSGQVNAEFFVKVTYCGQRLLVISYGTYPGVYSYALVYDMQLQRWGKLRIVHRDCFSYSYGSQEGDLTYAAVWDVSYEDLGETTYEDMVVASSPIVYPKQSVAFLLATGEIRIAVLDYREKLDTSESFVVIGRNQLSRARLSTLHEAEIEGLRPGGRVAVMTSSNGHTFDKREEGVLREQAGDYSEWGFDMPTGKNHTLFIKGDFSLTTLILHATHDGAI